MTCDITFTACGLNNFYGYAYSDHIIDGDNRLVESVVYESYHSPWFYDSRHIKQLLEFTKKVSKRTGQ